MSFVILYDCPLKTCDKLWLYNGLKKYGEVKTVSVLVNRSFFKISRSIPGHIGAMIVRLLIYIQCIRCVFVSDKNDIIVTWAKEQGYILNSVCRKMNIKRKIVSFMWIRLPTRDKNKIKKAFDDKNFIPIINNISLKNDFVEFFKLNEWNGMFLPDVFDDSCKFKKVKYRQGGYVFAGGVNNRDWDTLLLAAKETPNIRYIIAGSKGKIKKMHLSNVIIKEDITLGEYYNLMENSLITICPLKENRVSGLINILKSSQFGIPCISTELDVTSIYYSKKTKKSLLYERGNYVDLREKIMKICNLGDSDYIDLTMDFRNYIKDNFNPEKNVRELVSELKRRKWIA